MFRDDPGSLESALKAAEMSLDLTLPLRRLRDALEDLDRGIVAPVVKPVKLKGTPGTPAFKKRIKAIAVIAVEAGKAEKRFDTLEDGYREVASFLSRAGLSGHMGGPLKDTAVKDWRRDLIKRELENARSGIPPTRGVDLVTAAIYADAWFRKMPYDQLRNILRAMVEHYTQELKSEDLR